MIIDTRTIPSGSSVRSATIDSCAERPDWPAFTDGLTCCCGIDRIQHEICVRIELRGKLKLECARCLKPFAHEISAEMVVMLVHRSVNRRGADGGDDAAVFEYDEQTPEVDIGPAIYDEIITSLPMKPLCSDDCCGIEVNAGVGTDAFSPEQSGKPVDSRWNALKKLKEKNRSA